MIGFADAQSHKQPSGLEGEQKMSQLGQAQSTSNLKPKSTAIAAAFCAMPSRPSRPQGTRDPRIVRIESPGKEPQMSKWVAPAASGPPATTGYSVRLVVNGVEHWLSLDTCGRLLDALREHLALTGTKKGCD